MLYDAMKRMCSEMRSGVRAWIIEQFTHKLTAVSSKRNSKNN
ncbi:hypothetical protein HMPREF0424_0318 [Gardnerella vaginalis 409-05]|nr:hypothetical protein HMPREF0424_0318 [Gardnerella vaginalis 409-05]